MNQLEDAWRSLKRLVAEALPEPWTVRLEAAQYQESERPLAIVDTVGDLTRTGVKPTIPGGQHVMAQTFVITAYPAVGDDPREARAEATRALRALDEMVTVGMVTRHGEDLGGPLRLPMWDYDGVPLTGPDRGNRQNGWWQCMWAESWAGRVIADPQDDRRWTVPYTLRLTWDASGRVGPDAPLLRQISGKLVMDGVSRRSYFQERGAPEVPVSISMVPEVVDLEFYGGDGVTLKLNVTGADLTTGTVEAQVRASRDATTSVPFAVDLSAAASGVVGLSLTGAQTRTLVGKGVWDAQFTPTGGQPLTVVQGQVTCVQDVTRA